MGILSLLCLEIGGIGQMAAPKNGGRIGNLIIRIPFQDNILASQWREIKDEMGRNACLEKVPGCLGSGSRALRRGADRRGLRQDAADKPSWLWAGQVGGAAACPTDLGEFQRLTPGCA